MALLIPDAAGVYIDQKPPLIYNHQLEAWQDTEGYAHDNAFEAWCKAWPDDLTIFDNGDNPYRIYQSYSYSGGNSRIGSTIYMHVVGGSSDVHRVMVQTSVAIDVTKYSKYCMDYDTSGSSNAYMPIALFSEANKNLDPAKWSAALGFIGAASTSRKTIELDISNISGVRYVTILLQIVGGEASATIQKIWMK